MKNRALILCVLLVGLGATVLFKIRRQERQASVGLTIQAGLKPENIPPKPPIAFLPPPKLAQIQVPVALEAIQTLAATYDSRSIPTLARYLENDSREIREAALAGLVQLGHRDAVPYLQSAAAKTNDDQERLDLLKAADFLALPSWREHRPKLKDGSDSQP